MFKRGDEIRTRNGWRFVVAKVDMWSKDDGQVFGRVVDDKGKKSEAHYIGTVKGLKQADPYWCDRT